MEWVLAVVVVAVVIWGWKTYQARQIVHLRAQELARRAGKPTDQVFRDMWENKLTPGDWARRHGLDPLTFEPVPAPEDLAKQWKRVALDDDSDLPSMNVLRRIGDLQEEFAGLLLRNPPLLREMERMNEILVELHDLGARVDAEWVNAAVASSGIEPGEFNGVRTQAEYDAWQERLVGKRDGTGTDD